MNQRRKFVAALGAGLLAAPLGLHAQQQGKVWRIGFLGTASASGYVKEIDAIRTELRKLGYVENRNIHIEYRWAESDSARLKEMAAELVALKVDAIITHSTLGVQAAANATKTIPIIIADAPDPVALGFVASLARPGGNITGSTGFQTELAAKRLELLKEVIPRVKRVSVLISALNDRIGIVIDAMLAAAKSMQIELVQFPVKSTSEFPDAFSAMTKKRFEATVISEDPMLNANLGNIAALAAASRLPASGLTTFADAGGLLGYGANRPLL
jgi:putative ABC transport system substrate-binding protein